MTIILLLMKRDLLSTARVFCLSIIAELSRVSYIIVPHVYIPALETCTSLSVRSNDNIKSSIINGFILLPVKIPSLALRGLNFGSAHTTCALVDSIVIFTIHETVMSEPIRSVLEELTSIETAEKNLEF